MKKTIPAFVLTAAILITGFYQEIPAQSSSEVLMKSIAYHDSLNIWNDYSGKVNLITVFSGNRNSGGETIEIRTKDGFYLNTRPVTKTVRGIRNGECFLQVDGSAKTTTESQCASIRQSKAWHYFHFGILMELKASGLILGNMVETVKFQGKDCLALTFNYDPGTLKNDFYKDTNWTVFLNPSDYSLQGLKVTGRMKLYAVFSGILKVNGLKIPLCRTYFNNDDNSFYMVDLFTISDQK